MNGTSRSPACLADETLAAFAEGRLKRSEIPAVLAHLRECPRCMSALEVANEIAGPKEARPFRWWWAGVAAAAVLVVAIAVLLLRRDDPRARLVRLAGTDARPVETRLTAFPWAPYRGPLRAEGAQEDARRLQLAGAAGDAVARANADAASEAQWTAGVALLLAGEEENALKRLRAAAERAPNDAAVWSDLAAALDATGMQSERRSLHAEALASVERALAIDAALPAALFNRALILEHLGLSSEARKAWDRYLAADPSSPWANEARAHLRRLPVSTGEARFRAEQGNLASAAALVPAFPQQSRTYAEGLYLGRWGEKNDAAALDAARAVGEALAARSGESLLRDSVRAIDAADAGRRAQLAQAHAVYMRGRIALSKQEPVAAERDLRASAALFARAASPMSLVARHYAAAARFESDDAAGARTALEQLRAEMDAHPHYLAQRALVDWQLATIAMSDADWIGALEPLDESERLFRRLGERAHLGFIRAMQSTAMGGLGRPDEAWAARIEAFRMLDAEGYGERLPVAIGAAARMELYAGRTETARAFLHLEVEAVRGTKIDALLVNALVREALLHAQFGNPAAAAVSAREAMRVASSLTGPAREIAMADAALAEGAANGDAKALTAAIGAYRASRRAVFLPQAYLLRARASMGDRDAALRDLDEGMRVLERHRVRVAGPQIGTDIMDAGTALEREAIRLRMDMHDVAGVFREAERRNLRASIAADPPVALDAVQRRLAGTSTALLMLSMQAGEVIAIAVTESSADAARAPLDERTLDARIRGAADGNRNDAAALYDALVRPAASTLQHARRLLVVADPLLREVPYAALYDRVAGRHLIELMPVAVAENASTLRIERDASPQLAVAIALPSRELAALPDAQRELGDVAALYPRTVAMEPAAATFAAFTSAVARAGVVHVAGHTSRQRGTSDRVLPFSGRAATWRDLSGVRFDATAVVILAACETLRQPDARRTRALSLGGGVLAAGAGDVIGTLRPIADRDAAELFRGVHRGLAAGMDAPDALRRAQLDALASEVATGRASPWRAIALLTRRGPQHI